MDGLLQNKTFDAYWLGYLGAHTHRWNRMCHYIGTSVGVMGAMVAFVYVGFIAGLCVGVLGYAMALMGHFFFQKNRPHATRPHLGLVCDFLMLYLFVFNRQKLNEQLARTGN